MKTKKMEITYKGEKYPYREVELEDGNIVLISTTALEDEIFIGLSHDDEKAEDIDDMIYFYLTEDEWPLSDKEVVELINKNS